MTGQEESAGVVTCRDCSHLALAEEVLLSEGEKDDVPVVSRMFDAHVLSLVLQHSRRFVDDPVGAEQRQGHAAGRPHHVNADVHRHAGVRFADEADVEKFGHFLMDANVAVPVAALVPNQHQGHNFPGDLRIQKVCCASL